MTWSVGNRGLVCQGENPVGMMANHRLAEFVVTAVNFFLRSNPSEHSVLTDAEILVNRAWRLRDQREVDDTWTQWDIDAQTYFLGEPTLRE
jgi:hypothetical protein